MPSAFRERLSFANVAAALALFVAIGGGAVAVGAKPGKDGTIEACYKKNGKVRLLVGKDDECRKKKGEKPITWNVEGQQGELGAPGQNGADGQNGAPGANGSPDTPAQVLAKLVQVDGSGSGLEADLLDSAADINAGTLGAGRLNGAYGGITGLGSLDSLTVDGDSTLGDNAADTATINAGPVNLPNATSAADGLVLGGDADLFRGFAANQLRTSGDLRVDGELVAVDAQLGTAVGDSVEVFGTPIKFLNASDPDRALRFGPFDDAEDVNLYRSATDTLRTDGNFDVGGYLQLQTNPASPEPTDCNEAAEQGRAVVEADSGTTQLFVCVETAVADTYEWRSTDLT